MTTICTLCGRDDGHHTADNCPINKWGAAGEEVGAYLRARIIHDCDMDCMIWTGAVSGSRKTPSARIPGDGPVVSVRRWIMDRIHGVLPDGIRVIAVCNSDRCVNPGHMTPMTHSEVNRWIGKIGALRKPEIRAKRARLARERKSTLTRDAVNLAKGMREAGATYKEIGAALGIHLSTAHSVVTGKSWRDFEAELTIMQDRPKYLRALFAACPAGWTDQQIAAAVGDSLDDARSMLLDLWRERKAARVPNPRSKGVVWRTALAADDAAGFLFEPDGEMLHFNGRRPERLPKSMVAFARTSG